MYNPLTSVNLVLAILMIGLAAFYPYLTKRVAVWQKMQPQVRRPLTIGLQIFLILFAIHSLLSVLMDIEAITVPTERKIGPWIQGLIVLAVIYICVITLLARRKTKSQEIEKTLEEKKGSG